jgi:hypothetical protein
VDTVRAGTVVKPSSSDISRASAKSFQHRLGVMDAIDLTQLRWGLDESEIQAACKVFRIELAITGAKSMTS